jgi:maleate isomerase
MSEQETRPAAAYGWRAKIGLIVPPTNTVNEAEWQMMVPEGVTVHTTRMPLHADTTSVQGEQDLYADISRAVGDLAQARVDVIAYGCTAGSMVQPVARLEDYIKQVTGIAGITTAAAIVRALSILGITRLAIATPYHDVLNDHEVAFLQNQGFDTLSIRGLGLGAGGVHEYIQIAQTPVPDIMDHVILADVNDAEAMLISCTDFPVLTIISELEQRLGKAVVTSNQATFWAALRAAGIEDQFENYGLLLQQH